MEFDVHPIQMIRALKYKKKNKKKDIYPYSGLEVLMGGQRSRKNNKCRVYIKEKTKRLSKSNIYNKYRNKRHRK